MAEEFDSFGLSESIMIIKDGVEFYPEDVKEDNRENFTYKDIESFYDRVRSSLNISGSMISDDVIDYPENAPMAERRIKNRVPNWVELDDDKFSLFEMCIVYMTCYALCPMVSSRRHIEQTTPSLTLKFSDKGNDKLCDRFPTLIEELIGEILEEETDLFYGFEVTRPTRRCCNKLPPCKGGFV